MVDGTENAQRKAERIQKKTQVNTIYIANTEFVGIDSKENNQDFQTNSVIHILPVSYLCTNFHTCLLKIDCFYHNNPTCNAQILKCTPLICRKVTKEKPMVFFKEMTGLCAPETNTKALVCISYLILLTLKKLVDQSSKLVDHYFHDFNFQVLVRICSKH